VSCVQLGDTFYWKEGGHLWVVISNPDTHAGEFVIVNLTKDVFRAGKDCELHPADHKWITGSTYVSFGDARKLGVKEEINLTEQISLGTIKRHLPLSAALIQKIVAAGKKSKAMSEEYKALL
jgi:hypothetical protein